MERGWMERGWMGREGCMTSKESLVRGMSK